MVTAILGGILTSVAVAIAWDHARTTRRLRLARLLDDPRYGAAVERLWARQGAASAFPDAIEFLVERGISREVAHRNLSRILSSDPGTVKLDWNNEAAVAEPDALPDPWERRPTPATSSAFIIPAASFAAGLNRPSAR